MNKKLIATVVAASLVAPVVVYAQAEVTVYGRVVAGASYNDRDTVTDDGQDDSGSWNFGATGQGGEEWPSVPGSRIGFRGSQDLGNGLTAGFQIERGIAAAATTQRHNNLWINGGFGRLTLGQQSNPYMNARKWDQANHLGSHFGASFRHEGIGYSMSNGPFSLNILALASDTVTGRDAQMQARGVRMAGPTYAPELPELLMGQRVRSTHAGATVNTAGTTFTCGAGCEMPTASTATEVNEFGRGTPFANIGEYWRSTLVVAEPHETRTQVLNADVARVAERIPAHAPITGAAAEPAIDNSDSIDGWIIHAGYDFGPVQLDIGHEARARDVELAAQGAFVAPNAMPAAGMAGDAARAENARHLAQYTNQTNRNRGGVDAAANRDRTAIGLNGSVGPLNWHLAYETSQLNTDNYDNDTDSIGGTLGFNATEKDTLYVYHVDHSADRATYDAAGAVTLGEDYSETLFGYTRQMGPGLRFDFEYVTVDYDLDGANDDKRNFAFIGVTYSF